MSSVSLNYKPHRGQLHFHKAEEKRKLLVAGRRWGKSTCLLAEDFLKLYEYPGYIGWYISKTYKQLRPIWEEALRLYEPHIKKYRVTERDITFRWGSRLEFKTSEEPDNLRSVGADLIIVTIDEAAHFPPDIWSIVEFGLMDNNGWANFGSSPKGRNHFYDWFNKGQDSIELPCRTCGGVGCVMCTNGVTVKQNLLKDPDWRSWRYTSFDNPYLDPEVIKTMCRGKDKTWVSQEIYAQFLEFSGQAFPPWAISQCRRGEFSNPAFGYSEPILGHRYAMGVDLGRVRDFSAVAIFDLANNGLVYLKQFQGGWGEQKSRIKLIWEQYFKPICFIDATGGSVGDPITQALRAEGMTGVVGIQMKSQPKAAMMDRLRIGLEEEDLSWPDHVELEKQLLAYEKHETATGLTSYGAPSGEHDDLVTAIALTYSAVCSRGGGAKIKVSSL